LKALLKSSYTLIVGSLAFFVAVLVFSSLLTSAAMFQGMTQSIAATVKWEGMMANETKYSGKPVSISSALKEVKVLAERVAKANNELESDPRVNESVTYFAISFEPPTQTSSTATSRCAGFIDLTTYLGVLIVSGVRLNSSYVVWYPHAGQGYVARTYVSGSARLVNWSLVKGVLGITPKPPSPEVSKVLDDIVSNPTIPITKRAGFFSFVTNVVDLGINSVAYIVTTPDHVDTVLRLLNAMRDASIKYCGGVPSVKFSYVAALVDLKPGTYLNPTSISASITAAKAVIKDLGSKAGFKLVSTYPMERKLSAFTGLESFMRVGIVFGLVPVALMLIAAIPSVSESAILSVRRVLALVRLRGASPSRLKRWIWVATLSSGAVGFLIACGASWIISGIAYGSYSLALDVLSDPVFLAASVVLTVITLSYLAWKAGKVAATLPPKESLKTTLTPEALLEPLKMGKFGWFCLIIGLYFVVTGFAGFSAQTALMSAFTSGHASLGTVIGLIILATIESILKPFAPVMLAYGFAKLVTVHYDAVVGKVMSAATSGGKYGLVAKGLAMVMRRRAAATMMLTVFALTLMTQALILTTASQSVLNTSVAASVGAEVLGIKQVFSAWPSSAISALKKAPGVREGWSAAALGWDGEASINNTVFDVGVIIVPNPNELLRNTYWYPEWGVSKPFDDALKTLKPGEALYVAPRQATFLSAGRSLSVGERVSVCVDVECRVKISNVKIVGVVRGFPGKPYLAPSSVGRAAVVLGPWAIKALNESVHKSVTGGEQLLYPVFRVVVFTMNSSKASVLVNRGYNVVKLRDVTSSPQYRLTELIFGESTSSLAEASVILALSTAVAVMVAWTVSKEVGKVYVLLRLRGVGLGGLTKVNLLQWGTTSLIAALVGVATGGALGLGAVSTIIGSGAQSMVMSLMIGGAGVDPTLGVVRASLPMWGVALICVVTLALMFVPALVSMRAYRGVLRERFIEVR